MKDLSTDESPLNFLACYLTNHHMWFTSVNNSLYAVHYCTQN